MRNETILACGLLIGGLGLWVAPATADQAVPGPHPAAASLARTPQDVVLAVARRQLHELADGEYRRGTWEEVRASREARGVNWVYPWGVTLFGLLKTTDVTGDRTFADFVIRHNEIVARDWDYLRWVRDAFVATRPEAVRALLQASPIRRATHVTSLDIAGAMSAQMVETFLRHGAAPTPEEQALLGITTDWVVSGQSRLADGTFWRPESNQTLWIDDLFMSCSLLTRWFEYTGERKYIDEAARQILGMAARQQDQDGLWYHASFIAEQKASPYKWGRANGWVMVAVVEVLSLLPDGHPARAPILDVLRRHIDGIRPLQAPSGLWRQVLDRPELWEETSCSSMFAYSIARAARRGWVAPEDLDLARRAFAGVMTRVSPEGDVAGTCEGTLIGRDLAYYANRQRPLNDLHAPGPVLWAGTELIAAEKGVAAGQAPKQ
jgi:unsaturated rhamnogalacturonyl hydrolase